MSIDCRDCEKPDEEWLSGSEQLNAAVMHRERQISEIYFAGPLFPESERDGINGIGSGQIKYLLLLNKVIRQTSFLGLRVLILSALNQLKSTTLAGERPDHF
jgi:hypothetical protein